MLCPRQSSELKTPQLWLWGQKTAFRRNTWGDGMAGLRSAPRGGAEVQAVGLDNERGAWGGTFDKLIRPDFAASLSSRPRFLPGSRLTLAVLDLVALSSSVFGLIYATRERLGFHPDIEAIVAVSVILAGFMAFAYAVGCYRYDALVSFSVSITRFAVALGISTVILVPINHYLLGAAFAAPAFRSISRSVTLILLAVGSAMFGGMISRMAFAAMARRHWFRRSILVIGTGQRARYLRDLFRRSDRRLAQLHFLPEADFGGLQPPVFSSDPVRVVHNARSAEELETRFHIDQVVIAVDEPQGLRLDRLLPWKASGTPIFDFNTFLERETGRVELQWTQSDWLLYSEGFRFGWLDTVLKRLLDIVVSGAMLFVAVPIFLAVAIAIKFEDFGPVFYRQARVSSGGRTFDILKFRTMRVDAEKFGAQWAAENDPRITKIGRRLRRWRIDEVPQLLNVLRGDMSLVGPRPERPCFVEKLNESIPFYHLRHSVKAGITGWAQINYPYGASEEDAQRKLEYDLYYLKHFSVLRDVSIMLQTFRVLVFAHGSR